MSSRGYCEIGIYNSKSPVNVGTLWRSAYQLGAAGIFTIGRRYPKQASDTIKAWRHIPLRKFDTIQEWYTSLPCDATVVGVEMCGIQMDTFNHPERAIYLLGAEDSGLSLEALSYCHRVITLESIRSESYNVAVAGSLVLYHRMMQMKRCMQ